MNIEAKDFPLYRLLLTLNHPHVEELVSKFEKARAADDEPKFQFARSLFGIASLDGVEGNQIPGLTRSMRRQTLVKCLYVFEEIASRNHLGAATVASMCRAYGIGCKKNRAAARVWLDKAQTLVGTSPVIQLLREELGPRSHVSRPAQIGGSVENPKIRSGWFKKRSGGPRS